MLNDVKTEKHNGVLFRDIWSKFGESFRAVVLKMWSLGQHRQDCLQAC